MRVDTVITNGMAVLPVGIRRCGIAVHEGKIVSIASEECLPESKQLVDAQGNYVLPGLVDEHTHVDPQYLLHVQDIADCFEFETKAAVVGGVTTIGPMPIVPSISEHFEELKSACDGSSFCDAVFHFYASSERHLEELGHCPDLGIVTIGEMGGYKGRQGDEVSLEYLDDGRLYRFMEIVGQWGPPARLMLHAENVDIILELIKRIVAEGRKDCAAWTAARPAFCEAEKLSSYVAFAKATKCPIHIVHVTCREAIEVVRSAKSEGVDITAETCPQYLTFTKDTFKEYPPLANVNPPLREKEDNEALWEALNDGTIDTLATDHCTWTKEQKGEDIMAAPMGQCNVLSTWLPAMITYGVKTGKVSLEKLIQVCCSNPAKMMGIFPQKGCISVGSDADLVILDMSKKKIPKAKSLYSFSDINAYQILGAELQGWPVLTMVRGNVVMKDGQIVSEKGVGKYIPVRLRCTDTSGAAHE